MTHVTHVTHTANNKILITRLIESKIYGIEVDETITGKMVADFFSVNDIFFKQLSKLTKDK